MSLHLTQIEHIILDIIQLLGNSKNFRVQFNILFQDNQLFTIVFKGIPEHL